MEVNLSLNQSCKDVMTSISSQHCFLFSIIFLNHYIHLVISKPHRDSLAPPVHIFKSLWPDIEHTVAWPSFVKSSNKQTNT